MLAIETKNWEPIQIDRRITERANVPMKTSTNHRGQAKKLMSKQKLGTSFSIV